MQYHQANRGTFNINWSKTVQSEVAGKTPGATTPKSSRTMVFSSAAILLAMLVAAAIA
jgi:hypothetical protein